MRRLMSEESEMADVRWVKSEKIQLVVLLFINNLLHVISSSPDIFSAGRSRELPSDRMGYVDIINKLALN